MSSGACHFRNLLSGHSRGLGRCSIPQQKRHSKRESPYMRNMITGEAKAYVSSREFALDDLADIHRAMREARSATLVAATEEGLVGTPLPMLLDES